MKPLPECTLDYIEGIPGTTVALPYYTEADDANAETKKEDEDKAILHWTPKPKL